MIIKKQKIKSSVWSLSGNNAGVAFYSSRSWWIITVCKVYRDDPLHLDDAQENKSLRFLLLDHLVTDLHDHPFFSPPPLPVTWRVQINREFPVACSSHLSFSPFKRKLLAGVLLRGGGERDEYWFAAHFCKALFISHRCRKLNFDDVLSW